MERPDELGEAHEQSPPLPVLPCVSAVDDLYRAGEAPVTAVPSGRTSPCNDLQVPCRESGSRIDLERTRRRALRDEPKAALFPVLVKSRQARSHRISGGISHETEDLRLKATRRLRALGPRIRTTAYVRWSPSRCSKRPASSSGRRRRRASNSRTCVRPPRRVCLKAAVARNGVAAVSEGRFRAERPSAAR